MNTGRRWSWLRSGNEHWTSMVVVANEKREGGGRREKGEGGGRREKGGGQATNIKSNNPHLAMGIRLLREFIFVTGRGLDGNRLSKNQNLVGVRSDPTSNKNLTAFCRVGPLSICPSVYALNVLATSCPHVRKQRVPWTNCCLLGSFI